MSTRRFDAMTVAPFIGGGIALVLAIALAPIAPVYLEWRSERAIIRELSPVFIFATDVPGHPPEWLPEAVTAFVQAWYFRTTELYYMSGKATDGHLRAMIPLEHLRLLDVTDGDITDAGMGSLTKLPLLFHLTLAGTAVTDAGVELLADSGSLDDLDLSRTNITDECIPYLARMSMLCRVVLVDTRVTDEGAAALLAQRPELIVVR